MPQFPSCTAPFPSSAKNAENSKSQKSAKVRGRNEHRGRTARRMDLNATTQRGCSFSHKCYPQSNTKTMSETNIFHRQPKISVSLSNDRQPTVAASHDCPSHVTPLFPYPPTDLFRYSRHSGFFWVAVTTSGWFPIGGLIPFLIFVPSLRKHTHTRTHAHTNNLAESSNKHI